MSNLTPDDVDLRLTSVHSLLNEEDTRLWEGLEDEKISRIAGDDANKLFTEQVQGENQGTESRLSTEVIHRSEGDINNITSLNALAQALSDYRIKTDLEINQEKIAREHLGLELNGRMDTLQASFSHSNYLIYQAISEVQKDVNFKYDALDVRVRKYEEMLQDITTDSIQITMDNGEINMGAWTILSQAREWDLEILANVKVYQDKTTGDLNQALIDLQAKLPVEQDIIDRAIEGLGNSQIIKDLDDRLEASAADVSNVRLGLIKETQDRQDQMLGMAQDNANEFAKQSQELNDKLQAETNARILAVQREAAIRQQELLDEAADRTTEIDEKIAELELEIGDLTVIHDRIDAVEGKVTELDTRLTQGVADVNAAANSLNTKVDANKADADAKHTALVNKTDATNTSVKAEETARIAAVKALNDGLTAEIQFRKDGDTANLTALNNYKASNDTALANVRDALAVNVTATTANASAISALDTRLTTNESETATAKALAASATQKAETALSETASLATQMTTVNASIEDIQTDLGNKADASAVSTLQAQVTNIDGRVTTNTNALTALNTTVGTLDGTVKGHTTAITGLETKQTQQGTAIIQLATDTTALKNSVASIEGELDTKVDSSAFNQLSSTVTKNTNDITTNSNAITNLNTGLDLTNVEVNKKANSSTVTALDSKVTQQGNDIVSQGSAVTKLTNDLKITDDKVNTKADASALTALDTKVTLVDGKITSQGNQLTQLKNTVDGIELEIDGKADSSALTALDSKVTKQGTDIASNTSAITALTGKVTVVEGELTKKADATAVNNLTTRVETAEGKITSQGTAITKLTSDLATTDAKVNTKADATALTALDTKVTQQGNTITSQGSAITKLTNDLVITSQNVEKKADSTALTALTNTVTQQGNTLTSQGNQITTLNAAVSANALELKVAGMADILVNAKPDTTLFDEPTAMTGKVIRIGNNLGNDGHVFIGNSFVLIDPTKLYRVRYRYRRVEGDGTVYISLITSDATKTVNITQANRELPINDISDSNYFVGNKSPALGVWEVGEFFFKGKAATVSTGLGTLAVPKTFANRAAYFRVGILPNYASKPGIQDYDYIIVDEFSSMNAANANAKATQDLNAVVVQQGKDITSYSTSITTLTNGLSDANSKIALKADASAVTALDSKVTNIDGRVSTNTSNITSLTGRVSKTEGDLTQKADASAVNGLSTRVDSAEGNIASQGTAITKLTNDLAITDSKVATKAEASAVQALDNKVTQQGETITSQGSAITKLTNDLDTTNIEVGKKASTTALNALDTKVTQQGTVIEAQSTSITKLTSDLALTNTEVGKKADSSALSTLDTKVTGIDGRVTSQGTALTNLTADVTALTGVVNTKANASALTALDTKVTAIDGRVTSNSSAITNLTSRVTTAEGDISKKADASVLVNYSTKTETSTAIANANTSLKAELTQDIANSSELVEVTIDARALDPDRYHAVVTRLPGNKPSYLSIENIFFSDSIPPWATHPQGFSCILRWKSNGADWGVTTVNREIEAASYNYCIQAPFLWLTQYQNSSHETIHVRGGAKYKFFVSRGLTLTLRTTDIVLNGQTIVASIPWNAGQVPVPDVRAVATAVTNLTTTVTTLDGKVTTQGTALTKVTADLDQTNDLARFQGQGKLLFTDPTFLKGMNSVVYYNENAAMHSLVRAARSVDNPTASTHELTDTFIGDMNTGNFGFYPPVMSKPNKVFLHKYVIKMPVGFYISSAANAMGTGSSDRLVGPAIGTGKFETYWRVTKCGATGTFSTTGHIAFKRQASTPSPTPEAPIVCVIAQVAIFDVTDAPDAVPQDLWDKVNANATAVTTLDGKVTQQGKDITSQSTAQTALTNRVGVVEGQIATKADSSALQQLDSRVTVSEGKITSNTNAITSLNSSVTTLDGKVNTKADASALNNYYTKTQADTATAGQITKFQADLQVGTENLLTKARWSTPPFANVNQADKFEFKLVKATAPYTEWAKFGPWPTSVIQQGDNVTASFKIKALDATPLTVGGHTSGLSVDTLTLVILDGVVIEGARFHSGTPVVIPNDDKYHTVTIIFPAKNELTTDFFYIQPNRATSYDKPVNCSIKEVMISLGNAYVEWQQPYEVVKDAIAANATAIQSTNTEVTRINGVVVAQGTSITNLNATVAGKAETSALNTLQATVTQQGADITANSTATTNLTNRVAVAEGKIEANTTATSTLSNKVTELDGKITAQAAAITKVESDLTGLSTEIDKKANATALTSLETKVTEVDGKTTTLATSLTQLSTKVDGNSAAIAVQGTTIDGIKAEYSIKLDVNGMVSGIGLINTGSSSAISMNADMFYIGKAGAGGKKPFMVLTSPQTIGGVTYSAGTWIDVALIANATIGTAHIKDASITNAKIFELDASKITTGVLNAGRIRVGPTSSFDAGYNPATKARTFITQPTVPYSVGDIWKNGTSTYICKTQRVAGSFTASEWDKVGDVTSENTAANSNALGGTTASTINTNITNADTKATNAASTATAADTKATAADTKATLAQSAANSANNQVNAWKFTGTTDIDGGKIRADTVTAVQIDVAELSAISANLGTLTTTTDKGSTTMTGSLTEVRDASGQLRVKLGVW